MIVIKAVLRSEHQDDAGVSKYLNMSVIQVDIFCCDYLLFGINEGLKRCNEKRERGCSSNFTGMPFVIAISKP